MPRNPWSAGIAAFEESVARRSADRRTEEDRARRMQIDDENRQDRRWGRSIAERQLQSQDADRVRTDQIREDDLVARREAGAAIAAEKEAQRVARGQAIDAFKAAVLSGDKKAEQAAGLVLLEFGITPPRSAAGRAPVTQGGYVWEDKDGVYVRGAMVADKPAADRDNPNLPTGFKQELDWFTRNGKTIEEAKAEVARKWNAGEYAERYPKATAGEAMRYLEGTYDKDALGNYAPMARPGAGAPPPPPPGGDAPAAGSPPAEAPTAVTDEQIQEYLAQNGLPVTPANIAEIRKQLAQQPAAPTAPPVAPTFPANPALVNQGRPVR